MNHVPLGNEGRPGQPRAERLAIFLAGDDHEAKDVVAGLIDELGFALVDTGSLAGGWAPATAWRGHNNPLRAEEAEAASAGTCQASRPGGARRGASAPRGARVRREERRAVSTCRKRCALTVALLASSH